MTLEDLRGVWKGEQAVCIASGPSLCPEDCELVKNSALRTMVVNTSFRLAPWADALYAMDALWWKQYKDEVLATFSGLKLSLANYAPGIVPTKGRLYPPGHGNSGSYGISALIVMGVSRVLLLGYDCKFSDDGKKHWHEDHPPGMGNAMSIKRWPYQFDMIAKYAASHNVQVINCSRDTALTCFERGHLEKELLG